MESHGIFCAAGSGRARFRRRQCPGPGQRPSRRRRAEQRHRGFSWGTCTS